MGEQELNSLLFLLEFVHFLRELSIFLEAVQLYPLKMAARA
jgi:hypothetical protein